MSTQKTTRDPYPDFGVILSLSVMLASYLLTWALVRYWPLITAFFH